LNPVIKSRTPLQERRGHVEPAAAENGASYNTKRA
jgi:hypothetical protein